MSRHERLYRRLLIAYPRPYRLERGDEIVATILDQEDARGGGVRVGDLLNVILQGIRLRVAAARPASAALVAAGLAVVIALLVQVVSSPSYAATGTVRVLPGATQRGLSHDLTSSAVLRKASRSLHGVVPNCSVSSRTSRGLELTCQSSSGGSAAAMVHATLGAFLLEERALGTSKIVAEMQYLSVRSAQLESQINLARNAMRNETTQSPAFPVHRLRLQRLESWRAGVVLLRTKLTFLLFHDGASIAIVGVLPAHTFSSIELGDLLMAALIGAAIGLLASLFMRRRIPGPAIHQS